MKNSGKAKLLLSFDVEEFDLPEEFGVKVSDEEKDAISFEGTKAILDVVTSSGIKATFFTTGYFAERHPETMKFMAENGHEVASHGMNHSSFSVEDLASSKKLLEKISGREVTGFRMARLAKVGKEDILSAGYAYESSLNPVWLPGRYSNFTKPLLPFKEKCGLVQFPVSALPVVRFPLFWLAFKNLPLWSYKLLADLTVSAKGYYNMYSHPWEYNEKARDKKWNVPAYIVRHAGKDQCSRLSSLIEHLKGKGEFVTFQEYLKDASL